MRKFVPTIGMFAFLAIAFAMGKGGDKAHGWALKEIAQGDRLLCAGARGSDLYFAARSGDRIKIGSLIDVDEGLGYPLSFIFSFRFGDQKGEAIGAPGDPQVMKEGYVDIDGEYFAERIVSYEIYTKELETIQITVLLKRYTKAEHIPGKEDLQDSDLTTVFECRAPWQTNQESPI